MAKFKGWCPDCGEEEIYHEVLTEGRCLNCYQKLQDERKFMEIEARLDYEDNKMQWRE